MVFMSPWMGENYELICVYMNVIFCPVPLTTPHPSRYRKERCFVWDSQASPACLSDKSVVKMNMSMEHWFNDTEEGKPKYSWKSPSQCHFVHPKSDTD
jgi:hypothetical protein